MIQALSGVKILDLTMNLPGPFMTWLLSTLGAEVVKIEPPGSGDYTRALGSPDGRMSPAFNAVNRNKKSMTLNLKQPQGKDIFFRLLDDFDVLVEGFRPGVMAGFGLDYDTLKKRQPRLIQVSISGYGQEGLYQKRAGHDINYLALSGILSINGMRNGDLAVPGIQIADLAGGSLMALTGFLAALFQRSNTGQGQFVDVSMYDGSLSLTTFIYGLVSTGLDQALPGRMFLNGRLPCYGLYRTDDERYMSLGALEPKFWLNFCRGIQREDLIPSQFDENALPELEKIFQSKTQQEWIDLTRDIDACCEPVLTLPEAVDSPLCRDRGLAETLPDRTKVLKTPIRLSESPSPPDAPAPELGQHNRELLTAQGFTSEEIEDLSRSGVI